MDEGALSAYSSADGSSYTSQNYRADLALGCHWQLTRLESVRDFQCDGVSLPLPAYYSQLVHTRFGGWGWLLALTLPTHPNTPNSQ